MVEVSVSLRMSERRRGVSSAPGDKTSSAWQTAQSVSSSEKPWNYFHLTTSMMAPPLACSCGSSSCKYSEENYIRISHLHPFWGECFWNFVQRWKSWTETRSLSVFLWCIKNWIYQRKNTADLSPWISSSFLKPFGNSFDVKVHVELNTSIKPGPSKCQHNSYCKHVWTALALHNAEKEKYINQDNKKNTRAKKKGSQNKWNDLFMQQDWYKIV